VSKWNEAISVTFNDNDGKVGWRIYSNAVPDIERHWRIFGIWRTRWILFKQFWLAMKQIEVWAGKEVPNRKVPKWIFKSEIPE